MPKLLDKMVGQIKKKGVPNSMAYGMAVASLQKAGLLKRDSIDLTKKGEEMNRFLTPNIVAGMGNKKKKGTVTKKKAKMPMKKSSPSKATKGRKPMKKMTTKKKKS